MEKLSLRDAIAKAVQYLQESKDSALIVLSEAPESGHIRLLVEADLNQVIRKLSHLGGVAISTGEAVVEYKPIVIEGMLTAADASLDPNEAEQAAFLAKVEKLYLEIESLSPYGVINSIEDYVIRGVAKKAGVAGFEHDEITVQFIEKVQDAVKDQQKVLEHDKLVQAQIEKEEKLAAVKDRLKEVTAKKAEIDEELQTAKAALDQLKPGKAQEKASNAVKTLVEEQKAAEDLLADLEAQIKELSE